MARKELTIAADAQGLLIDAGCGWQLRRSRAAVETDRGTAVAPPLLNPQPDRPPHP